MTPDAIRATDGSFLIRNARWLSAGVLMTFLSCFGQTFFISVFAGEIRTEFGLSHGEWGGIYSVGTTASAIVMVWAGVLSDRFRLRGLGTLILTGIAVACLAMAANPWPWALAGVVFLLRFFGQGMASHVAMVAMARWFVATRGRALAIATLGFAVGEALLPVLFVALMAEFDWRILWVVCAGVSVLGIPLLLALLRQERSPQQSATDQSVAGMDGRHWTRKQALHHPLFWLLTPAILGPSAFVTAFFFHQVHLAGIKGWSHLELVAWFPVYTGVSVVSMLVSGWALDRFGTRRLMPFYLLPMALAFLIFAYGNQPLAIASGFTLLGLTAGANATLPAAFWADTYGTAHIGAIKALATAVMVLGSAIGPGVTGYLIDIGIGIETQFIAVAGFFVLTAGIVSFAVMRYRIN